MRRFVSLVWLVGIGNLVGPATASAGTFTENWSSLSGWTQVHGSHSVSSGELVSGNMTTHVVPSIVVAPAGFSDPDVITLSAMMTRTAGGASFTLKRNSSMEG